MLHPELYLQNLPSSLTLLVVQLNMKHSGAIYPDAFDLSFFPRLPQSLLNLAVASYGPSNFNMSYFSTLPRHLTDLHIEAAVHTMRSPVPHLLVTSEHIKCLPRTLISISTDLGLSPTVTQDRWSHSIPPYLENYPPSWLLSIWPPQRKV